MVIKLLIKKVVCACLGILVFLSCCFASVPFAVVDIELVEVTRYPYAFLASVLQFTSICFINFLILNYIFNNKPQNAIMHFLIVVISVIVFCVGIWLNEVAVTSMEPFNTGLHYIGRRHDDNQAFLSVYFKVIVIDILIFIAAVTIKRVVQNRKRFYSK